MEDKNMFTNVIKQISNSMIENMSKSLTDGFNQVNDCIINSIKKKDKQINVAINIAKENNEQAKLLIQEKDRQIDEIANMIGLKSSNKKVLSKALKSKVETIYKKKVWQNTKEYINAKNKVFDKFKVCKWEDIPIRNFANVETYIKSLTYNKLEK